jgi:beta-N-acetylhexosaminidase
MTVANSSPRAVIFGCKSYDLSDEERAFFHDADPVGFILFERNCQSPDQVRRLCASLRGSVGRADAPILIDQEGGRVRRLKPPHWRIAQSARTFADLAARDAAKGFEAIRLNAQLMACELADLGIDVDCAPVLDLPQSDADPIIGDRAYGADPATVSRLARAVAEGLIAGGVIPVIKHIPGHGRARADSHKELPRVEASHAELSAHDFRPFHALADAPMGMTAHVVFEAIDPDAPATLSHKVIETVIRGEIGFDGWLMSDDLSMKALSGSFEDRARASLDAGCDVVLHCNGDMAEMRAVASATRAMDDDSVRRLQHARDLLKSSHAPGNTFGDAIAGEARLAELLSA